MPKPVKRINLEHEPEPVREFLERLWTEGTDVVVEHEGQAVLAIVSPQELERWAKPEQAVLAASERAECLAKLFGAWREVDTDAMLAYIYEGRTLDERPSVEL